MNVKGNTVGAVTYAFRWARFVVGLIPNHDVVWVDTADGSEERERWTRRSQYRVLRPNYYGWLKRLDCGCSRRFGSIVLFVMDCEKHGPSSGGEIEA